MRVRSVVLLGAAATRVVVDKWTSPGDDDAVVENDGVLECASACALDARRVCEGISTMANALVRSASTFGAAVVVCGGVDMTVTRR